MKSPICPECGTPAKYFTLKFYNPWNFKCRGCGSDLRSSMLYTFFIFSIIIVSVSYAILVDPYVESGQWNLLTEFSYLTLYMLLVVFIGRVVWSFVKLHRRVQSKISVAATGPRRPLRFTPVGTSTPWLKNKVTHLINTKDDHGRSIRTIEFN